MNWKVPLSFGCLLLGILVAFQFKTQKQEGFPFVSYPSTDLIRILREKERENHTLQEEITHLRKQLASLESNTQPTSSKTLLLKKELEDARMQAGMIPLQGPGIEVILNDSPRHPVSGEDDYFYLIHDVDLIQLVNELWAAGAEAISINQERLVAGTSIRCVGPTILVNTTRISPPYVVKAIGDPDTLATALKMHGGFLDSMSLAIAHGVTIKVEKKSNLQLPAYGGVFLFHHAKPLF
jgi:uncharacterized protein YlxW (UPF0749 family)